MGITFEERNIPVEFYAKAGSCLFLRSSLVTKEDMEIDVRMRSQRSEPCCMVLDRVSCYYGQPSHSKHPISTITSAPLACSNRHSNSLSLTWVAGASNSASTSQ